jgi:hypothetical protein
LLWERTLEDPAGEFRKGLDEMTFENTEQTEITEQTKSFLGFFRLFRLFRLFRILPCAHFPAGRIRQQDLEACPPREWC